MKLEIKNISVNSLVVSSLPLVVFVIAVLGGAVTFIIEPNPQFSMMGAAQKLLAVGLYSLLYAVLVSALFVFIAFVYNILTGVLGMRGVSFDLEEVHEHE
ncbi:MAG TPA: hypothetical protein DCL44_03245 [Elusimicrobia bacterium]|nr:hypothetical protein [Elusimicrobiota bacterium]